MFCECGCGQVTKLAKGTDATKGWVKGQPLRFIKYHQRRVYQRYDYTTDSVEYKAWWSMIDRCTNPKNRSYHRYGGRGIKVTGPLQTFDGFMAIMGKRPSLSLSLDRINNDGNYEIGNVRWATKSQQSSNQRRPKLDREQAKTLRELKAVGVSAKELAVQFGISRRHVHHIVQMRYWK